MRRGYLIRLSHRHQKRLRRIDVTSRFARREALGKLSRAAGYVVVSSLLGSCGGPVGLPSTQGPNTGQSFDGAYNGTVRLVSSEANYNNLCWTGGPMALQVRGGAFHYVLEQPSVPGSPSFPWDMHINPDGSFASQSLTGEIPMSGRVVGSHMVGRIDGVACGYSFQVDRS
jgi:hypothetical protein